MKETNANESKLNHELSRYHHYNAKFVKNYTYAHIEASVDLNYFTWVFDLGLVEQRCFAQLHA
jgi:hypothetical protein